MRLVRAYKARLTARKDKDATNTISAKLIYIESIE